MVVTTAPRQSDGARAISIHNVQKANANASFVPATPATPLTLLAVERAELLVVMAMHSRVVRARSRR
jgi:hypothetical protein